MDPILVTGGTGTLGRLVVRLLRERGRDVRVLTRHGGKGESNLRFFTGDLLSGSGEIGSAVEGVATIVHCAGSQRGDEIATRNLVEIAARGGRPHLVNVSVVGADRIPVKGPVDRAMFGYFEMKRKTEEVVTASSLPWTTLRASQFYDLVLTVVKALTKLPVVPVASGTAFQPVDTEEVAHRLVELAEGPPAGLVPDMAGPRVYSMAELVHRYLEAVHRHRWVLPLWLPGAAARAIRSGANLAPSQAVGKKTWEAFLQEKLQYQPRNVDARRPAHT